MPLTVDESAFWAWRAYSVTHCILCKDIYSHQLTIYRYCLLLRDVWVDAYIEWHETLGLDKFSKWYSLAWEKLGMSPLLQLHDYLSIASPGSPKLLLHAEASGRILRQGIFPLSATVDARYGQVASWGESGGFPRIYIEGVDTHCCVYALIREV